MVRDEWRMPTTSSLILELNLRIMSTGPFLCVIFVAYYWKIRRSTLRKPSQVIIMGPKNFARGEVACREAEWWPSFGSGRGD